MPAYYSEFDPKAAAWLRELIKRGLIADGVVDERDLWDVAPADLRDFAQVHLCAGIGVWSYALRSAGWSDDRPVWTGSFPCQPFSAAGKGEGFADERHLWPAGCHLIAECRPAVVFGEQVASKDAEPWLDLVQADLEALDYAVGAVPFPSAGVGAPHIRDRLYWVADAQRAAQSRQRSISGSLVRHQDAARSTRSGMADSLGRDAGDAGVFQRHAVVAAVGLGHPERVGTGWDPGTSIGAKRRDRSRDVGDDTRPSSSLAGGLADADGGDAGAERQQRGREQRQLPQDGGTGWLADAAGPIAELAARSGPGSGEAERTGPLGKSERRSAVPGAPAAGPTNGLWQDADWLFCRDGKWRPVEPGTFPLAHGSPARVGRLRGYGNAINAEAAKVFIEAYLDTRAIEAGA